MPNNQKKKEEKDVKKLKNVTKAVASTNKNSISSKNTSKQKKASNSNSTAKKSVTNPVKKEKRVIEKPSDKGDSVTKSSTTKSKKDLKAPKVGVEKQEKNKSVSSTKEDKKVPKSTATKGKSLSKTTKVGAEKQEKNKPVSSTKKDKKVSSNSTTKGKNSSKVVKIEEEKQEKNRIVSSNKVRKKVLEKNKKQKLGIISSLKQLFLEKKVNLFRTKRAIPDFKDKSKKKKKNKVTSNKQTQQKKYQKSKNKSIFISKKCIITVVLVCVSLILLETAYFIYHRINVERKLVYYDSLNSLCIDNSNIVLVGSSNFKYSKNYDYTEGLEKAKFIKYDRSGKILLEKMYENGINTTFSSIISISDGYMVVGSGEFSEQEQQNGGREAIIIKYDKEGNIVWEKYYQVVTNTRFNKVIEVEDGYIAIGQSIYANMEMGNHTTGGGIIVKYDKNGNEVWHNNHGGMKSGNFYDIVAIDGDLYVVGKDATDSGNLVKFNRNGEYQWHKNYSYTDGIGFTGIAYLDQYLYVVGAKKVLPESVGDEDNRDTQNTDALLIKYDKNGNIVFEKSFGGSSYERYNAILAYHNNLYVVGYSTSKDAGVKINTDGKLMTGILVRYDGNGNILKKETLGGSNNDNLTDIVTDGVSLYISAYSNSKDGNITTSKNNGKDYFGKMIKLDFKFRTLLVK